MLEASNIRPAELGITFVPANDEKSFKYPYAIVKELGIPFFCVVDRDVFQPYTGQDHKSSIGEDGLPTYKPELKTSSAICGLLSRVDKENLLSNLIAGRYDQVLIILDNYSIITMRYAIEVDLIACPSFCRAFCDILGVEGENRTPRYLAIQRSGAIKKLDVICEVLNRNSTKKPSCFV